MAYYYHDPSGLGVWYVQDGQTPAQALAGLQEDQGLQVSPILQYSVDNTPSAHQVNGGNPAPSNTTSPPQPTNYANQGASLVPTRKVLTSYQQANAVKPRYRNVTTTPGQTGEQPGCDDGYFYDEFLLMCVPINDGPGSPGIPTGTIISGAANPVYVQVNNAVTLADGVGQAIGDTINKDVQSAIDATNNAIDQTANSIGTVLQDVTSKVGSLVDGIIQNIYKALSWLGNLIINNIGNIVGALKDKIGAIVDTVSNVVNNVVIPLAKDIETVINKVNDVLQNTIAPVFNTIQQVYQQTAAAIEAIKQDLSHGLTGILQLPSDVSQSITSIEATIQRTLDQIGGLKRGSATVFTSPGGDDAIWDRLKNIGTSLAAPQGVSNLHTTFGDKVNLSNPTLTQIGSQALEVLHKLGLEAIAMEGKYHDDVNATLRRSYTDIGGLAGSLATLGVDWFLVTATVGATLLPVYEAVKNQAYANVPISKLSPGEAVQAYVRAFLSKEDASKEMTFAGLDASRQQTLFDLSKWLAPMNEALEWWFRGIIDDKDLTQNMTDHGVIADDQLAIKESGFKRLAVALVLTARRWNIIDDAAMDAALKQNRYTDIEIAMEHATLYQLPTADDVIHRENFEHLYATLGFSDPLFATPSQGYLDASQRDGNSPEVAALRWKTSFYVHPIGEWLRLFYRGLRTRRELDAAFDYFRVPHQFRDDIISANRSLIPWRTIPTMLANGIIDEPYAKQQLQAHGFDLAATEALLKYAQIARSNRKVAPSGDLHSLSIQTVRHYFEAGTLDAQQYKQLLLEHGYDAASADLTISVETKLAAALQRKQLASDLVAEVNAGTITLDQALTQADAHQFAPLEKAKLANAIHRIKRQTAKVPSEAELHSMAKAGAISQADYSTAMSQLGWSESWIENFVKWRFPHATPSASTA